MQIEKTFTNRKRKKIKEKNRIRTIKKKNKEKQKNSTIKNFKNSKNGFNVKALEKRSLSKGSKIYFFICNAQAKTPFNQVNRRS